MDGRNYYAPGQWNLLCDSCNKKIKSSEARNRWDGFIVCSSCYEVRHPQDFLRAKMDKISVPFTRPRGTDVYVDVPYIVPISCTPTTRLGMADVGIADCAQADISIPGHL